MTTLPALFQPYQIGALSFANRIVISPMCQYSAANGAATDWHMIHLGSLALSGAGLLVVEATAVEPDGRISPGDLGLWNDECEAALARVLAACRTYGSGRIGIQIAHAGRKASCQTPWDGGKPLTQAEGAWQTVAPSALPFSSNAPPPRACTRADLERLVAAFAATTKRAARLGFDVCELHAAHGYLMHEFLSPISNRRDDAYGGSLENRMRFPLEVFAAMRAAWPKDRPIGARITGADWIDGGWTTDDAIAFAQALKQRGCDFVDVSSGGLSPDARIKLEPGYQVPFAKAVKRATGLPTWAVGLITTPEQANAIVANGEADMVALARAFLDDPHWPWHAAAALGVDIDYVRQYARSHPKLWPGRVIASSTPTGR